MIPISIPEIHGWSNPYCSSIPSIFGRGRCRRGELWGLCQLLVRQIAHQHGIGARQLCAFEVALRVPHSVLQDEAVRLQICLLQQADPVFFPRVHSAYGQYIPKGCWHTRGVTLRALFPPLSSRRRCYHSVEAPIQNRRPCRCGGGLGNVSLHCSTHARTDERSGASLTVSTPCDPSASRRSPHTLLASGAEVLWRDPEAAGVDDAMIEVEKGTPHALKHTAARQGRHDLIA
jgi:hypothetical protein